MARYTIIGLGTFGFNVASKLFEKGHEVIGIDIKEDLVQKAQPLISQAIVADATDQETLKALGIEDSEYVVISVGNKIDTSILITLYVKEMGIENIIVKAVNEVHGRILKQVGATEIVFPEKEMAHRIADRIGHKSVLDFIKLSDEISIMEIEVPEDLVGKTISESKFRQKFNVNIVAIKTHVGEIYRMVIPTPEYVFRREDALVVVGEEKMLDLLKKLNK